MAAAVWFYFVTPAVKQMVYAPLVLIGSGVSGLMVMVFSFVTDVLSSEKVGRAFKQEKYSVIELLVELNDETQSNG